MPDPTDAVTERRPDRVLGGPHDEFWAYCDADELRLQRCGECHELNWPPVRACEHCGGTGLSWERLSGRGTIFSWCSLHQQYYESLDTPWDAILVALDEGPLFVSDPVGFGYDDITFGKPVAVQFIPCHDGHGEFRLPVFGEA